MKKFFFALALMSMLCFGGLVIERASAQNSNSSTTMEQNSNNMGMRRRHGRHHRRHSRHRMRRATGNANT